MVVPLCFRFTGIWKKTNRETRRQNSSLKKRAPQKANMQSMKALFIRDSCARYQWSMSSKTKKKKTTNAFAWLLFLLFLFYYTFRWDGACSGTSSHTNTTTWLFALAQLWVAAAEAAARLLLWGILSDSVMCIEKRNDGTGLSAFPNSIRQLTKMEIQLDISNRQCVCVCPTGQQY